MFSFRLSNDVCVVTLHITPKTMSANPMPESVTLGRQIMQTAKVQMLKPFQCFKTLAVCARQQTLETQITVY